MARILVIENDFEASTEIVSWLLMRGFQAEQCFDGRTGLKTALAEPFDAIILASMVSGLDGLRVMQTRRNGGCRAPVLMMCTPGDADDQVTDLRAGGDDYLIRPFATAELIMRLEALLRSHRCWGATGNVLRVNDLELNVALGEAKRGGRLIELLPAEFKLLGFMMCNAGQALSRRTLFEAVWEYYFDPGSDLIDTYVSAINRKLDIHSCPPVIEFDRGIGYRIRIRPVGNAIFRPNSREK